MPGRAVQLLPTTMTRFPAFAPSATASAIELPDEYPGLDPDLRAYLRAPYDPLNSVMAARFIARGLLREPLIKYEVGSTKYEVVSLCR